MAFEATGRSLDFFFVDGRSNGMLAATIFADNYAFNSPSAAASVVAGYSSIGPLQWKLKGQTKTYKQWEAETLGSSGAVEQ